MDVSGRWGEVDPTQLDGKLCSAQKGYLTLLRTGFDIPLLLCNNEPTHLLWHWHNISSVRIRPSLRDKVQLPSHRAKEYFCL